jgi:hypothetical protein
VIAKMSLQAGIYSSPCRGFKNVAAGWNIFQSLQRKVTAGVFEITPAEGIP